MATSAAPTPASMILFIPTPSLRGLAADRYHDEIAQSINRYGQVTIAAALLYQCHSAGPAAALPSGVSGKQDLGEALPAARTAAWFDEAERLRCVRRTA